MTQEQIEAAELAKDMKYGAEQVVTLVKPVSITMMVVVATIRSVTVFAGLFPARLATMHQTPPALMSAILAL